MRWHVNDVTSLFAPEIDEINKQTIEKKLQLDDARKQFDVYKAKMEALLISQLELLKEINKNDEE